MAKAPTMRDRVRSQGRQSAGDDVAHGRTHLAERDKTAWITESHEWRSAYDMAWTYWHHGPGRFIDNPGA